MDLNSITQPKQAPAMKKANQAKLLTHSQKTWRLNQVLKQAKKSGTHSTPGSNKLKLVPNPLLFTLQ
jgi:hypothetical protein